MEEQLKAYVAHANQRFAEIEARLYVAEFIAANTEATLFGLNGFSLDEMKALHQSLRDQLSKVVFPAVGPAASDAWAGEIQMAMDRLLTRIEAMLEEKLGG
ncbi:MAG: hypothetical protein SGJ23_09730, partial [Alphaproteobacteria bacterium]|nr:hypothetical protein [Alphaproteobacteria bacterium]